MPTTFSGVLPLSLLALMLAGCGAPSPASLCEKSQHVRDGDNCSWDFTCDGGRDELRVACSLDVQNLAYACTCIRNNVIQKTFLANDVICDTDRIKATAATGCEWPDLAP